MQILQMIIILLILVFAAMYVTFKSPKLKMSDIINDISKGVVLREDIMNNILENAKAILGDEYSQLKEEMKMFEEVKILKTPYEKVIFDEKMEDLVLSFLKLPRRYEELKDNFEFVSLMLRYNDLETRIVNTKYRYNGFVDKFNKRREATLGSIFAKIYRFEKLEKIYISSSIVDVLNSN